MPALGDPQPAMSRQEAIQARLLAIRDRRRALQHNPVAADEARRLGEREDDEPPATVDAAADVLAAVLPVASRETWIRQQDGTWACRETGHVVDECPV